MTRSRMLVIVLIAAAVCMVSAGVGAAWCVEDVASIRAADGCVKPFYDDITIAYHRVMPFDHQIGDDESLLHKKRISFYKHPILKPKLDKQIIRSAGIEESDYTFGLNGNAELLWKYENKKEDSYVYLVWIGDVDGDEVSDGIVVDGWIDIDDDEAVDGWNETGKLFLMSGKTGFALWNRSYDRQIEIAGSIGDEDGDGVEDVIIYSESNPDLAVDMELISGIDGNTLWSKTTTPTGLYCTGYAWGETHENDLNGDLVNDVIFGWYCWEEDISVLQAVSGKDGSEIWQSKIFEGDLWDDIPCELPDLNGDGIGDYVTSGYSYDTDRGCVTALSGKDGSEIWSRSITGDPWTVPYFDFNKDGIVDVVIEVYDRNTGTGSIFMIDGRDGSTIWSRSYRCLSVDCWLYDDIDNDGIYDLVVGSDTVQMLSGATGNAIWEKDYAASAGTCKDIDGDGKNDVLAVNYTQIDSHNYLYNVTALSGINGNEIWKNGFMHHVEVIPPEGVWNNTYCCAFSHGWSDQNGDGVPDPYLDIEHQCSYWNESASEYEEHSALKFIVMDGSNGGDMWDAEITSTGWNGVYHTDFGYDFDDDGVNDMFINTQSGMYAVKTTGAGSVNRPPIASFTYTPANPSIYDAITFDASTSHDPDGAIVSYGWDFGDGNTTTTSDPVITHFYASEGDYNVDLTVTDDDGAMDSVTKTISTEAFVTLDVTLEGHFGGITFACAISGDYAYIGQGQDLVVLDVSSPASHVEMGRVMTSGIIYDVAVSGNYAYVADRSNGLVIVDVSDKSAPTLAGGYDTAGWAYGVAVSGDYAYVADDYNGLVIVDVSDKAKPTLAGSYNTAGCAEGVAVSGDYVYVADWYNGLVIVDVSDKAKPTLAGSYNTAGDAWGVAVSGDYAYVADRSNGLVIVDVSDKSAPTLAGGYDTEYALGVAVSGDYAYVADWYNGLVIVDVSDKAKPTLAGSYDTAGYALGVAVSGEYVYVADGSNGLVILRVNTSGTTDTTPPMLTIASPAPDTTTHSPTITIAGTASDPSGIASVTANGALADGAADWSTWSAEVTLTEGENTITVVATNTTGGSRTKTIAITYTPILDGKVLSSSTNDGIENATVSLVGTGKTAQTGTNGYYSFSGVADGSYTLTASKSGYTFSPVDVVVSEATRASPIMGTLDTTVINATITSTVMPSGSFEPGDSVEVTITAKNTGTIEHTFYIGYSVRDPDDTFWDALYVPVTLSSGDIATETLSWTVQPGAPAGSYDIYTAVWATQHWSYLYDNLDRENAYEVFSVQPNHLEHIPGWTFKNDERYDVLVDSEKYRAILTINDPNRYISWMIYDSDGKVPDLTTFQHAAKTATVAAMVGSDTTDEVAGLRHVQESMNEFTGWISLAKFALWARDAGAYLTGKLVLLASTGGTSITTEIPASVVSHEIAVGLSEKIVNDLTPGASNLKDIVSAYAIIKVQHSASKLGEAANALEEYDGGLWTYHEANRYYDNYKYGAIDGMAYMTLTSELQPGSDFVSQMCGVCNEVLKGATYGVIDFDALTVVELANSIEDLDAVKSSAIMGEKYRDRFAVTDARFGANAIELWDAYQTANKVSGSLMCPGNLHAYDSQGRHVGVNSTGGIDLEIPNSYYSGPDVEPEIISIYTPQDDNITFCVDNATTTGMFNLTLEKQMNMTMDTVCYLNIPITETTAVSISTNNSSNPDHIMEIDSDDDGVVDWIVNPNSTETNHKPVSRINPPSQIAFAEDYPVLITGNGIDVEDGELSEDALTWTSSVDGLIGSGSMLNTTNLSIGNHTIVLTVIDSNGAMSMDSIEIRIYMVTTGELIGDLNGDDAITPTDAAIALEIAAGSRPFDDAADVNDDGMVTSLDALMILQAAARRIVL